MTDPSPDAAQPPVPHQPMPCLGRGVHWPDIMAKIEADRRDKPAPAGVLDHARRQLGIENAAKEAAQFADEALELAELALPAANEALAAVGGESGNAPSTPSLGETGSSLGIESAPGHRNGCQGCEHDEGVIPGCWSEQDEEEWYALFRAPSFTSINERRAETGLPPVDLPMLWGTPPSPARRARWRRALDRMRRSQP